LNMWKKVLIILLFLLGLTAGVLIYKYSGKTSEPVSSMPNVQGNVVKDLAHYNEPFQWGALMRPYALGSENYPQSWEEQIAIAKQLGIGWGRVNWESDSTLERNDDIVNRLLKQNMNIVLVIEKATDSPDDYQSGYNDGVKIATRYKGKIRFYQLMNEISAQVTNSATSGGQKESDYDEAKYQKVTAYLKGLSDGITKADSNAWMIVPIAYTQTGFIDKILQDNIKFDIIGVDWYDWAGNIATKKMDDGTLYSNKLKSYNKPIMFMEVNAVPTSADGSERKTIVDEQKQSDFISQIATWAYQNKDLVKGFYVHELIDNVSNTQNNYQLFGIYTATKVPDQPGVLGAPRQAFKTYQALIKKFSK